MANSRIHRAELNVTGDIPGGAFSRVHRAELSLSTAASAFSRIHRADLHLSAAAPVYSRIHRAALSLLPGVSAGPDQGAIEPWSPILLVGEGAGTARSWVQIIGTPVTLIQGVDPTDADTFAALIVEAPPSVTDEILVFEYRSDGKADTVDIGVMAATERAYNIDGTEWPLRIQAY